jgi:hypothetical protein
MTFVGTGAATHTNVHEDFHGTKPVEPLFEAFINYLFPVFRKFPVFIKAAPLPWVRKAHILNAFGVRSITSNPLPDFNRGIHPSPGGRFMVYF